MYYINLVTLLLLICNANDNKNNGKMGLLHLTCKKQPLSMSFIIRLDPKSRLFVPFLFSQKQKPYIVVIKDKLFTTFYRSTYIWNGLSLVFARMNTSASLTLFLRNTIINNLQINRHMPKAMYLSKLNKKYHFFCNLWINLNGKLNRVLN